MKKLMIIPALLLVAALFITCDTKGDWGNIMCPLIPMENEDDIIYTSFDGWNVEEPTVGATDGGNLSILWDTPISNNGKSSLVIAYSGSADFGWWSGGQANSGGAGAAAGDTVGYKQPIHNYYKGFWVVTLELKGSTLGYVEITGGGPNLNPGWVFGNVLGMWFE